MSFNDVFGTGLSDDNLAAIANTVRGVLTSSNVTQIATPNVRGDLVLTQGDTYDGIGNAKANWTVETDYTDGWSVLFTIRNSSDEIVLTTTGTVESTTLVTVGLTVPIGLEFTGCPGVWQGKFDVQLSKNSSVKTIAIGKCYINENQTR